MLLSQNALLKTCEKKLKKGNQKKIEEGYFIGQVPYGYKKLDKNTTVLHPQKSKFVKRAFEVYAQGNISLKSLVKQLYNEGFTYTSSHPKISTGQLEKMLKNDCYTGMLRHRGKLYRGKHEPIVSKSLFLKVQKAFKKDNKPDTRQAHNFIYKGLMTCSECGCAITSEIKRNKWIYYHCTGNSKTPCTQKKQYIKQEEIDEQIDTAIKKVVIDDSLADYINELLEESYKEMQLNTQQKHEYLQTEIKKLETRKDKLFDLYMDGDIDKQKWSEKNYQYETEIERYKNELKNFKLTSDEFIDKGKNIIELSKQTYNLYKKQTAEEKRRLLEVMFEQITVENRLIKYTYKMPFCYFAQCNMEDVNGIVDYIKQNIA